MCWVAAITLGTSLLQGMQQAKETRSATRAAVQSANAGAAEAGRQALMSERDAAESIERGEEERSRLMQSFAQEQGARRAGQGASGVDLQSGSTLDFLSAAAAGAEDSAKTIRKNAARQARGQREQAAAARAQAENYRNQAKAAKKAGKNRQTLLGIGTLSSGLGNGVKLGGEISSFIEKMNQEKEGKE